jgi:eukaryotic-like serine/threonine-protein kinase
MTLSAGTTLGPYQILAPLGAGGMGEVYRARDERLKRDVAVKVLPAELSADAERRTRFEREARAASALSHPNILTIYDIGSSNGTVYIAMELVDGGTLKDLTASGPVPTRKLLELATQVADGLAAAHAAGIVHRDLKPANVMVSKHGYAKILDFGLAKLVTPEDQEVSGLKTAAGDATRPGMVMGTVGYMSPEQAAGRTVDYRSDQFSFGSILYEMATGKRAFERSTTAETLTAIIREEPEPVSQLNARIPAPVRWIVERCLTKDPEDRYGTTKDLARDLAQIRDHLSEAPVSAEVSGARASAALEVPKAWRSLLPWLVGAAVLAAVVGFGAYAAGRKSVVSAIPSFRQLTFQRGEIHTARFAPDGQTVIYSAAWEDRPVEIFVSRLESPESRPFGLKGASLLSVSSTGELAVSLNRRSAGGFSRTGTLARIGMTGGGTPREIQEDVQAADWTPDGTNLAIVRTVDGHNRLEYPIGKVLFDAGSGWISYPRISRDGGTVAFMEHPTFPDDGGYVSVVDREGHKKTLTPLYAAEAGLAWSPRGDEIWFAAAEVGNNSLYAATRSGSIRPLARVTGNLVLHDVTADGRVLLSHDTLRSGMLGLAPGETKERDLSWLDWSNVVDISPDGKTMVFFESGEGGGPGYSCYLRTTDGSPPVRLGEGSAQAMSPDGKWVLSIVHSTTDQQGVLLPTGAGDPKTLPTQGLQLTNANWFPDGKRILLTAKESGRGSRLYTLEFDGGKPRAISPVGYVAFPRSMSPDGKRVAVRGPDNRIYLYPVDGGEPTVLPGLDTNDIPCGWTPDGGDLFVFRRGEFPGRLFRFNLTTGEKQLAKTFSPGDPAGILSIGAPRMTPDGKAYVYAYNRILSDLFLAEGIK